MQNARLLSGNEFMSLISNVRIGVSLGMVDRVTLEQLDRLLIDAQAGALMETAGEDLDPAQRDIRRAQLVRSTL